MHGRLKVKTTAEQQEAKKKEREKKLKLYSAGTEKVFTKRRNGEYDQEGLTVSGELLAANPDFYTLWNFRRETLEHLHKDQSDEEMTEMYETELRFLESCLKVNPKSYGTWHHRCWVMDHTPKPNWTRELKLCNKCLELDERNFHCWDYRRFVVGRAEVSLKEEFAFTTDKISSNFSNFSSWHYRSKLLPQLHPDASNPVGIDESALLQEYELTQNAFFTDPNDQSAWFYYRWLLGRGEKPFHICLLYVCRARPSPLVMVTLTKVAQVEKDCNLLLTVDNEPIDCVWYTPNHTNYNNIWCCNVDSLIGESERNIQVRLLSGNCEKVIDNWCCVLDKGTSNAKHTSKFKVFGTELSACAKTTLKEQLEQCQQLHEMEPENKWAMLTILALTRALNPLKYAGETFTFLDKLRDVDPMRANYYNDLRSKYVIENAIEAVPKGGTVTLSLPSCQLTSLYHMDHLVIYQTVDLSNNLLTTLHGFEVMKCLKVLCVDNNRVASCEGLQELDCLEELSIRNNHVSDVDALGQLKFCPKLGTINLEENPLCSTADYVCIVKELLPQVSTVS